MAKPSWCLLVITMYFIPASSAICTHSSALNFTGLNWVASCSYSFTGILARFMIHSPMPGIGLPFPFAGGDAVQAPVDEQAELGLAEPFHFGILGRVRSGRRSRTVRNGGLPGRARNRGLRRSVLRDGGVYAKQGRYGGGGDLYR